MVQPVLMILWGCGGASPDMAPAPIQDAPTAVAKKEEGKVGKKDSSKGRFRPSSATVADKVDRLEALTAADLGGGPGAPPGASPPPPPDDAPGATLRSWFPESFLWAPLVETGPGGTASVSVTVPDTLTTWQVLGLGQSREGAQGGDIATFRSTLPAYVDLAVPAFLHVGDRPELAVQVVNQQGEALRSPLTVEVTGGSGALAGAVEVAPWGSLTRRLALTASRPGELVIRAGIGAIDEVERRVPVRPVGRPEVVSRGGTLGAPRSFTLPIAADGREGRLAVRVFPGALAVVASEVASAPGRGGSPWADAYTCALVSRGGALVESGALSPDALRALRLGAWQALRRWSVEQGLPYLLPMVAGLAAAGTSPVEVRAYERAATLLAARQQSDGLWGLEGGAQLDAVLAQTAMAAWVLDLPGAAATGAGTSRATAGAPGASSAAANPASTALDRQRRAVRLRARGALERYRDRLQSPHVAGWALLAGLVDGALAEQARATLVAAMQTEADGGRHLAAVGVRPDGSPASDVENTALAALVLPDEALRADLVTWLLSRARPGLGFGDGLSDLLALRALDAALGGAIPAEVAVILEVDGVEVARAALDPTHPHQPVTLVGPGLVARGGVAPTVRLRAEPAVPGLAFAAEHTAWRPWIQATPAGLDLEVRPTAALVAGQETALELRVAAPAGSVVDVEVGLAAGVELVEQDVSGVTIEDHGDHFTLRGVRVEDGAWTARVRVRPSVAGRLWTAPSAVGIEAGGAEQRFERVPGVWVVR